MEAAVQTQRRAADSFAEQAMRNVTALEKATLHPFIVELRYRPRVSYHDGSSQIEYDGAYELIRQVVQAPLSEPPRGEDYVPENAVPGSLRADVFPCVRFDDMPMQVRANYTAAYGQFLLWRKAWSMQKPVAALVPWTDYSPITIDESVQRWARGGVHYFAGD